MKKIISVCIFLSLLLVLSCSKRENRYTEEFTMKETVENELINFKGVSFESGYWIVDTTTVEDGAYKISLTQEHNHQNTDALIVSYIHDEVLDVNSYMKSLKRQVSGRKSIEEYATFTDMKRIESEDGIDIFECSFPVIKENESPSNKGYIRVYLDKVNKRTFSLFVVGRFYNIDHTMYKETIDSFRFSK